MLNIICLQHYDEQIVIGRLNDAIKTIAVMSHFSKLCQFAPQNSSTSCYHKGFYYKIIITTLFAEITGRSTDNPGFHTLSVYTSDGFLR